MIVNTEGVSVELTAHDVIRVILADDHAVVRAGLKAILASAPGISVVALASNGREAVDMVAREPADVIVMDLSMSHLDGISATREIRKGGTGIRVLVLTGHSEEDYLVAALEAGASGYLLKSAADRELVDAVRALAHGDMYLQPSAARVLASRMQRDLPGDAERRKLTQLSEREHAVLTLVARGYSGPAIGEQLSISAKTVDTYRQRINEKLGVSGRPEYVEFALRVGLLTPNYSLVAAAQD